MYLSKNSAFPRENLGDDLFNLGVIIIPKIIFLLGEKGVIWRGGIFNNRGFFVIKKFIYSRRWRVVVWRDTHPKSRNAIFCGFLSLEGGCGRVGF